MGTCVPKGEMFVADKGNMNTGDGKCLAVPVPECICREIEQVYKFFEWRIYQIIVIQYLSYNTFKQTIFFFVMVTILCGKPISDGIKA